MTPFINVDLLIKTKYGVLLTWRDDVHSGKGWHIPGGIVRYKEHINSRIGKVASSELGIKITDSKFIELNEIIVKRKKNRAHFISLLYECTVSNEDINYLINISSKSADSINFFKKPPVNLLKYHLIYKEKIC
jgi:colanic acid biosynthesis protein WcaH